MKKIAKHIVLFGVSLAVSMALFRVVFVPEMPILLSNCLLFRNSPVIVVINQTGAELQNVTLSGNGIDIHHAHLKNNDYFRASVHPDDEDGIITVCAIIGSDEICTNLFAYFGNSCHNMVIIKVNKRSQITAKSNISLLLY